MADNQRIEQALKECEEKFSKVFRQSPLALMLTSAKDHRYIDVNETFEGITGWSRDEVIGRTPFDIGIWVNPNQRLDFVRTLLSGGTVRNLEMRVRMKNGEVRAGIGSAELIEINGEQCVLGMAMVTDLKQASEGEKVPERLSSMARRLFQAHDEERAAIARDLHDYIDRLLLLSMDLESVSQEMDGAKQQIEDLVRDIQTLSRRLYYSKLEYLGLTAAAASFCKELSDQKNLEIEFESKGIPKELPKEISFCLFHVLREALQNATKHSGSRNFQVSLSVASDEIHLTVRDSGVGFDPEEVPQGSGLGFDLMKERLKLVDGQLSIESQRERGSTIHVRLPLKTKGEFARAAGE